MPYNFDYFISYAHNDNKTNDGSPGFVDVFYQKLINSSEHQKMFGGKVKVFFDKEEIRSMSDWDNRIRSALASSRFLIALMSPNYFKSEYSAYEFEWWLQHEMHRRVLGEGAAPMIIVEVDHLRDGNVPFPLCMKEELQKKFPNWISQIRMRQINDDFDMHDLVLSKIDETLRALRVSMSDKVDKQNRADNSKSNWGYPRYNKNFVGRHENLRQLRKSLSEGDESITAISAVNGLGGIGKTELALTYGHAFAWDYELGRVFATCENKSSLVSALLSSGIARMNEWELPKGSEEQQLTFLFNKLDAKRNEIIARNEAEGVELNRGAHLLLILDNVNDLSLISRRSLSRLPSYFHVIITTRESANRFPHIHTELVDKLDEKDSLDLLCNLRPFGDDPQEVEAARKIAQLLDGFTLAVEMTGAYLSLNQSVSYQMQYERLNNDYNNTVHNMVEQTDNVLAWHPAQSINTVLQSTFDVLSENALKAVQFASVMSPDAVAIPWLGEFLGLDDEAWNNVLEELKNYRLLSPLDNEPRVARIHRLVAKSVQEKFIGSSLTSIQQTIRDKVENDLLATEDLFLRKRLKKDESYWCKSENSWQLIPIFSFYEILLEQSDDTVESTIKKVEIFRFLAWMLEALGNTVKAKEAFQIYYEQTKKYAAQYPDNIDLQIAHGLSLIYMGNLENTTGNRILRREYNETSHEILNFVQDNNSCEFENESQNDATTENNYVNAYNWFFSLLQDERFQNNVKVIRNLAIVCNKCGDSESFNGNVSEVKKWYLSSYEYFKRLSDQIKQLGLTVGEEEVLRGLTVSYERLGDFEVEQKNYSQAEEWYLLYLHASAELLNIQTHKKLREKTLDLSGIVPTHQESIEVNCRATYEALRAVALSYESLGDLYYYRSKFDDACKEYDNARLVYEILVSEMPKNVVPFRDLSLTYERLGSALISSRPLEAMLFFMQASWIDKHLMEKHPDVQLYVNAFNYDLQKIGEAFTKQIQEMSATKKDDFIRQLNEMIDNFNAQLPKSVSTKGNKSYLYAKFSQLALANKDYQTAKRWCEKALAIVIELRQNESMTKQYQEEAAMYSENLKKIEELIETEEAQ